MDVSRDFFGMVRAMAVTLEKEVQRLERALRREDADDEEEPPARVLCDLHSEIKTLKEDVNASLAKISSEKEAINDFMKASEILLQRNAADLGKIKLLQKQPDTDSAVVDSDSTVSVTNESDEEKAGDVPHLPACPEKPPMPKDWLCSPQLSDFGLSQYAFSRPWSAVKEQHAMSAHQEKSKNETPLKPQTQTPCLLAKTPKCMLKMDDYECVTPKLEHFSISEHTMCMNEDYTMSLIRKTAQTSENTLPVCCKGLKYLVDLTSCNFVFQVFSFEAGEKNNILQCTYYKTEPKRHEFLICTLMGKHWRSNHADSIPFAVISSFHLRANRGVWFFRLVKKDDCEVNVPEMISREMMVTPGPKPKTTAQNAGWMASPMILVLCTPSVKTPPTTTSTVLSRSPETNELPLPRNTGQTGTPQLPEFQTRWLKPEAKVVNSTDVRFPPLFTVKQEEKTESVTKNNATEKHQYTEDSVPFAVSSDEYLKHFGDPSPPKIKQYDQLFSTPPPPEITRIPDDVLQILSKYNRKADSSKAKETETKAQTTTRYESDFTDYGNKENR
ncbi:SKA3 protein, partial [Rhynochetos jubatus]|nr:SKA3 protein [Rhynochetos jubatus]